MEKTYLDQQAPQRNIEAHEIPRVGRQDVRKLAADVFGGGAHGRLDRLARRVHQQLGEPFEDELDLFRVRFLEVGRAEGDADVADAAGDFAVGLSEENVRILKRAMRRWMGNWGELVLPGA